MICCSCRAEPGRSQKLGYADRMSWIASKSLQGELVAVHQEQHLLDPAGLEEPFEVQADQVGLAGAGGKLDQEAALAQLEAVVEGAHRLGLIRPYVAGLALAGVVLGDLDGGERLARRAHLHEPFQVAAGEEAGDLACVLVSVVPEVGQFAVGEENERRAECLRVGQRLLLGDIGIDGVLLGFDHGQRAAALVVEDVVGAAVRAVIGRGVDLGPDHRLVGRVPAGLSQQLVYLDAASASLSGWVIRELHSRSGTGSGGVSPLARMSATTSWMSSRSPARASWGVGASQLSDGNSAQSATCSSSSADHVTRYV